MSGPRAHVVSELAASGVKHVYVDGGMTVQDFSVVVGSTISPSIGIRC